jgi:neutral trehalase
MFNQQNIKVGNCNVVENINKNVMRSIKDKGKLVMDEGGPSQIELTLTIGLGKTLKEIKLEFNKRKKVYELK